MLRRVASKASSSVAAVSSVACLSNAMRFARSLPQGFEFLDNKVNELDLHAAGETLPSMQVNITRHDEFVFSSGDVKACVVPANDGEAGVAPGHEYEIAKLDPGVIQVETLDGKTLKFVTAGGFAHINPAGSVDINCCECVPVDDLDVNLATKFLAQAQESAKVAQTDKAKAVAELEVQMYEAVVNAFKASAH
jgi:F0F1-type ATP synthase epsilon subunit